MKIVISPECGLTRDRQGFSKLGAMHIANCSDMRLPKRMGISLSEQAGIVSRLAMAGSSN